MRFPGALAIACIAFAACAPRAFAAGSGPTIRWLPAAAATAPAGARPADAVPGSRIGQGTHDIARAWFSQLTSRYGHRALGEGTESATLNVELRDGRVLRHTLEEAAVFEDLDPRVYDLDGDGRDEVLVVRSDRASGASLLTLGVRDGALVPLARSAPTGRGFTWMNPAGVLPIAGQAGSVVFAVLLPHVGGTLLALRYDRNGFSEMHRIEGASNHAYGSRVQRLSALLDVDGDGAPELVIPAFGRRALRVFAWRDGRLQDTGRIDLPAAASGEFEVLPGRGLAVPLEDGRRMRLHWR